MTPENARRLNLLSRQLTENLMSAALCAKEISLLSQAEVEAHEGGNQTGINGDGRRRPGTVASPRPLLDEDALSVVWGGKTLHLGHTRGFWLLARLARRPNLYVTHLDLLREVWDDELMDTTVIRSAVQRLRLKLRSGGMSDLAAALTGHHGRYKLDLSNALRHSEVTAVPRRASQR